MKIKRFLGLTLALIILTSVLSVNVFASNANPTAVYNFVLPDSVNFRHTDPRLKTDSTPFYVYITGSMNPIVKVEARGYTSYSTNQYDGRALTWSEGEIVPYVICWRGSEHWVHQYINEYGFTYASAGFSAAYTYDEISFMWSPDTYDRYTSAVY